MSQQRVSARVIVIDELSRILLVSSRDPDGGLTVWYTPGGEVEPGEALEQAARREMQEELHLRVGHLEGPVWERRFPHTFVGRYIDAHEWFFVTRVRTSDILDARETGAGSEYFTGWRWWSLHDLEAFDGIVAPKRLPQLLRPILHGGSPKAPLEIGE